MARPRTPIAQARNLGPQTAIELVAVGITTVEDLVEIGWREAYARVTAVFPNRINLNMCCALIGAVEDLDWRRLPPELREEARKITAASRRATRQ